MNQSIGLYRGWRTAQNEWMVASAARAFWIAAPGHGEIRAEPLEPKGPDQVLIRTQYSGISRGTEALVFNGHVPATEYQRMRAPFQSGDFPAPVKYGYSSVGIVEDGPGELAGRRVFALFPHQTRYVVPIEAAHVLPDAVPSGRAVLAANIETALNGLWDAELKSGQRVTVVGAGTVGCLVAWVARSEGGCDVELVDTNPQRAIAAAALGVNFRSTSSASPGADVVIHVSGSPTGLDLALRIARFEATIVEMSWYGDLVVPLKLGEHFHAQRLTLKSSQVGVVARSRRNAWTRRRRMDYAIALLNDPALDTLITGESPFEDLPRVMSQLAASPGDTLCHRIAYV
jgi:2-desacetyl-2-hydroxyethyl bacteriochlorophyllide A dehydrogenase